MSVHHVEISIQELDSLLSLLQTAQYLETEYYSMTMTGSQADHLRPHGSNVCRNAQAFITKAQNVFYDKASDEERTQFAELLADRLVHVPNQRTSDDLPPEPR